MKKILLFGLSILSSWLSAQDKYTVIEIKKAMWNVAIVGSDSVFWIGKQNRLQLLVDGGANYEVELIGGSIRRGANRKDYFVVVLEEGAAALTVYELLPKNKRRVLFSKLFEVKKMPVPVAYVCGVKADSVIDKIQIIRDNKITVVDTLHHVQFPVLGFTLVFEYDTQSDTLVSSNNKLTPDMKRRIYYLASGTMLNVEAVYYKSVEGEIRQTAPFSLFINESNKYKVGYAQIIKE